MGADAKRVNYWQTTLKDKARCTLVQQDAEELLLAIIGRLREESEEVVTFYTTIFHAEIQQVVRASCCHVAIALQEDFTLTYGRGIGLNKHYDVRQLSTTLASQKAQEAVCRQISTTALKLLHPILLDHFASCFFSPTSLLPFLSFFLSLLEMHLRHPMKGSSSSISAAQADWKKMKAFRVTDLATKAAAKQQQMVNRQKTFAASAVTTSGVASGKDSASFTPVQAPSGPLSKAQQRTRWAAGRLHWRRRWQPPPSFMPSITTSVPSSPTPSSPHPATLLTPQSASAPVLAPMSAPVPPPLTAAQPRKVKLSSSEHRRIQQEKANAAKPGSTSPSPSLASKPPLPPPPLWPASLHQLLPAPVPTAAANPTAAADSTAGAIPTDVADPFSAAESAA
ncbi:MAG: hypothetical protein FRX49_04906 [Trebouxia sp. A1-2]|nr:MAG: hypothetical protein FRX49_04906 [Trebouxia sp. A1-2]